MLKFNEAAAETITPEPGRATAITPLEMRQTSFASGWRGYSREAVRAFLVDASESYELSLRENERLKQDIERLQASIRQYQDLESGLKSTLVHAQKARELCEVGVQARHLFGDVAAFGEEHHFLREPCRIDLDISEQAANAGLQLLPVFDEQRGQAALDLFQPTLDEANTLEDIAS